MTVFKFTYLQSVKSKAFILVTIIAVGLVGLMLNINTIKEKISGESKVKIAFCDYNEEFDLNDDSFRNLTIDKCEYSIIDKDEQDNTKESIKNKESDYDYLVTLYSKDKEEIEVYTERNSDSDTINNISSYLKNMYIANRAENSNMNINEYNTLMADVPVNLVELDAQSLGEVLLIYILIFILYMVIMFYGNIVASSVIEEKNNRIMENLITISRPIELLFGKVIGICAVTLTQLLILVGAAAIFIKCNDSITSMINDININIDAKLVVCLVTFALLGYLLYAFIFAAMGSLVSTTQDSTQVMLPMTSLIMIVLVVAVWSLNTPDSTLSTVLSYIPFSSPIFMFMRIVLSDVPVINVLISIGILILSIAFVGFISSKVYKRGVLHYGKKASYFKILFNR